MGADAGFPYPAGGCVPMAVHAPAGDAGRFPNGVGAMKSVTKGFTLLELVVTLAVLAVVLGIGLPAFGPAIERIRVTNTYNVLTTSLMSARATAIARGEPVTVCPSHDGLHCRDDHIWEDGWIIFLDAQRTGDPASPRSILRRIDSIGAHLTLRSTQGRPRVRYLSNGRAPGSNVSLRLCGREDERLIGMVVVNNSGRARSQRFDGTTSCSSEL